MHVHTRPLIRRDRPSHERTSALLLLYTPYLRPIFALPRIKVITVLKGDPTEIEIMPPNLVTGWPEKGTSSYLNQLSSAYLTGNTIYAIFEHSP